MLCELRLEKRVRELSVSLMSVRQVKGISKPCASFGMSTLTGHHGHRAGGRDSAILSSRFWSSAQFRSNLRFLSSTPKPVPKRSSVVGSGTELGGLNEER